MLLPQGLYLLPSHWVEQTCCFLCAKCWVPFLLPTLSPLICFPWSGPPVDPPSASEVCGILWICCCVYFMMVPSMAEVNPSLPVLCPPCCHLFSVSHLGQLRLRVGESWTSQKVWGRQWYQVYTCWGPLTFNKWPLLELLLTVSCGLVLSLTVKGVVCWAVQEAKPVTIKILPKVLVCYAHVVGIVSIPCFLRKAKPRHLPLFKKKWAKIGLFLESTAIGVQYLCILGHRSLTGHDGVHL